jgi:serine protease Do
VAERCITQLQRYDLPLGAPALSASTTVPRDAPGSGKVAAALQGLPRLALLIAAGISLVGIVLVFWLRSRVPDEAAPSQSQRHVVQAVEQAAVEIRCGESLGAGFLVEPDLVVTNAHVLCSDDEQLRVTLLNGSRLHARVEQRDDWLDVALLRTSSAGGTPLPLGDATALQRGDPVLVMGNPRGLGFTLSQGIISHPSRAIMGISYLQIDATIHPGNSGGPLLDTNGRAIGIMTMMVGESSSIGLALPVNYLVAGNKALLATSGVEIDIAAWSACLRQAFKVDQEDVASFRSEMQKPAILAAALVPPGALVALVGRKADSNPVSRELLSFTLSRDGSQLCTPDGVVENWHQVPELEPEVGSRFLMWLERNSLVQEMYSAVVPLRMIGCPAPERIIGSQLTLEGGVSHANTVTVAPGQRSLFGSAR